MIEVQKLIPKIYNQSRDFSVFTGVLQIMLNELDIKSFKLSKLPNESILPGELSTYNHLRGYFRFLLKNKGTIECILQAIHLAGGETICPLENEKDNIPNTFRAEYSEYKTIDRLLDNNKGLVNNGNKEYFVYYLSTHPQVNIRELNINLKDPSKINQSLLDKIFYYIKPVDLVIKLNKGKTNL